MKSITRKKVKILVAILGIVFCINSILAKDYLSLVVFIGMYIAYGYSKKLRRKAFWLAETYIGFQFVIQMLRLMGYM